MTSSGLSGRGAGRWLTWANGVTALRLVAAPACACALLDGAHGVAAALFALAVATDVVDGRLARRRGEASPLGGLLDHATDATFVAVGLGALAATGEVPVLLPLLVAAAFAQYVFDSRAHVGAPLRGSALGRWNGIAYFVALGVPVVRDALGLAWPGPAWVRAFAWLLVASSLLSIADRVRSRPPAR
jgi:phosphatidylglycerophosphate synthase